MFPKLRPSSISVIIPVLHEADRINRTLGHIKSADPQSRTEIIVVDGDPAGGTLREVVEPDITKIYAPAGRSIQMNAGAAIAGGDILLFLHADTLLPETGVKSIRDVCRDPGIVGGAFDLAIDAPGSVFRVIEKTASLRSRLTRIPYGDQAIFIKAVCFRQLGGFAQIPLMEDIDLMRRIKRRGYRIRFITEPVKTDARRWKTEGVLYTTLRNWMLSTLFYAGVSPEKLKKYY